jgi:RimJ/RimL family protein N-acetyltransferase
MRLLAKQHFRANGFSGLSTRISPENKASLVSAKKIGFEVVSLLPKEVVVSGSYYLVCDLESGD